MLTAPRESSSFRTLLFCDFLFYSGIWTQTFVLAWLAYELTSSPFQMAIFGSARFAPLLLGPIGGLFAERFDRVRFLSAAQVMVLIAILLTTLLVASGHVRYEHLLLAAFLIGLGHSPTQPARFTLVMDYVGARRVSNANALSSVVMTVTGVLAPVLGGAMVTGLGVTGALLVSASWNALAIAGLRRITAPPRSAPTGERLGILADLRGGLEVAIRDRQLLGVLIVNFAANVLVFPIYQSFMPVFAKDVFLQGVTGLSWIMGSVGLGALIGALVLAALGDFAHKGAAFLIGTGLFGAFLAMFANAPTYEVALVLIFVAGLGSAAFTVMQSTLLLLVAEEHVRGRVMGLQVLAIGALPVSGIAHGYLASALGVVTTTSVAGALLAICMVTLWVTIPGIRSIR